MSLLYDMFCARVCAHPARPALMQGAMVVDFSALAQMTEDAGRELSARGVGPGRPVVISRPNGPGVAAGVAAAWSLGSFPVFVSPDAPPDLLNHAVEQSHAAWVLATNQPATTDRDYRSGRLNMRAIDIGSVIYTSGSTGRPKGIIQSQETLLDGARRIGTLTGYRAEDRILCPVPWSHDYGWGQLLTALLLGIPLVLPETRSIQSLSNAIELHRPTVIAGTPSVFAGMVYGISDIRKADLSSLCKATSTGSHLAPELVAELRKLLGNIAVYSNYGLSETYRSACLLPQDRKGRAQSVGRPVEGVDIRIIDPVGEMLPPGKTGQVVHCGAGCFAGYLGDQKRTARCRIGENQVLTGDLGFLDSEGYLYLVGRRDRTIKTMDVQVNLDAIEKRLYASGMLQQIAVVARDNKISGKKTEAHVVLKNGADLTNFRKFARLNLSKYQFPRAVYVVSTLPVTPSGKTDYAALSG